MLEIPLIRTPSLCVYMCVCAGFPLRGHGLGPCVILASCSHGCCEIPAHVERITLKLCECVFAYRNVLLEAADVVNVVFQLLFMNSSGYSGTLPYPPKVFIFFHLTAANPSGFNWDFMW